MAELWALSATDIAAMIRSGDVSAEEVTRATLDRIDAVNGTVNALAYVRHDAAIADARAVDAARRQGADLPPMAGVPTTTKINTDEAGAATTNGIRAGLNVIAETDSPPVANLRRAGAVFVGRSNAPAFSLRWFTDNDVHGRTLNPWDRDVTPGGSSGGAAAAVATGMCAVGGGNDYGGSIRHPAAMCGVVGFRPSTGRVPAYNASSAVERPISNQLFSVNGPLTRTVADAELAFAAMIAADPRDPFHVPLGYSPAAAPARVAVMRENPDGPTSPEVAAAIDAAANALRDAGAEVIDIPPPHFDEATKLWRAMVYEDVLRVSMPTIEAHGDAAVKRVMALITEGAETPPLADVVNAYGRRMAMARDWSLYFDRTPVLLTAVSWRHGMKVGADLQSAEDLGAIVSDLSPLLGTAMLGLPGLTVPVAVAGGLPVGVQLVANRWREDLLISTGRLLEAAFPPNTPIAPT